MEAHRYAKEIGAKTACVVADKGGKIIGMSDFAMIIPSENYGIVEEFWDMQSHSRFMQTMWGRKAYWRMKICILRH